MNLIYNEYKYNENFKKYVDEFCARTGCEIKDALEEEEIKRMFWRYTEL